MAKKGMEWYAYSQWYPYLNTQTSYIANKQIVGLPRMICDYIIDAPNGDYAPPDNNDFSRCRLWKYLYHDDAKPLEKALPTIEQKMQVVYNPEQSENPPTEKGYRLFPQLWVKPSQTVAQTRLYVYLGRTVPNDNFKVAVAVHFRIWCHYAYETNTRAEVYDRAIGIEQALLEAFNGVNMAGIGTFGFSKRVHPDCGSNVIADKDINIGRELILGLELATTALNEANDYNNMSNFGNGVKLW